MKNELFIKLGFAMVLLMVSVLIFYSRLMLTLLTAQQTISQYEMNQNELENSCAKLTSLIRSISGFFLIMNLILWGTISALLLLQEKTIEVHIINRIISTGIHVPIAFLVCSYSIKAIGKQMLKSWMITVDQLQEAILIVTVCLDLCLLLIDWQLSLFLLSILFGKGVWLDGIHFNKKTIVYFVRKLKSNRFEGMPEMTYLYGRWMIELTVVIIFGLVFFQVIT